MIRSITPTTRRNIPALGKVDAVAVSEVLADLAALAPKGT